jgi:hypothetical protein
MGYLTIAAMFLLVLWPVWVPLAIHGTHMIANLRRRPGNRERLPLAEAS